MDIEIHSIVILTHMIYNYFKIIIRNSLTDRMYNCIIVFGLAIGIAASLMIAQYIHFELSFDKQYKMQIVFTTPICDGTPIK